jgi:hypothetical protein
MLLLETGKLAKVLQKSIICGHPKSQKNKPSLKFVTKKSLENHRK